MGQHARLTNYDMSRKITSKIYQSVIVKPTKAPEDSNIEELKSKRIRVCSGSEIEPEATVHLPDFADQRSPVREHVHVHMHTHTRAHSVRTPPQRRRRARLMPVPT